MVDVIATDAEADGQLIEDWLLGKSDKTKEAYKRDVSEFLEWADLPELEDVDVALLKRWGEQLEASEFARNTVVRKMRAVKSLFSFAYETDYIEKNIAKLVRVSSAPNRFNERIISPSEVRDLIETLPEGHDRILVLTLYGLGLRASEVADLQWRDKLRDGKVKIRDSKNRKDRVLPVPDGIWEEWGHLRCLALRTGPENYMFQTEYGEKLTRQDVWKIVKQAAEMSSIDTERYSVSPHWLRHCHASHAINNGAPVSLVQARLGHESLDTTSLYVHANSEPSGKYLELLNELYGQADREELQSRATNAISTLAESGATREELMELVEEAIECADR